MVASVFIYFSAFLTSMGLGKIYSIKSKKNDFKLGRIETKIWIILIIAPVVFISTYRYNVGTDFFNYSEIFRYINSVPLSLTITNYTYSNEALFVVLNKIVGIVFNDFKGMLFINSILIHVLITDTLFYFQKEISIPLGLFISYMFHFSTGLNVMRQMIAMAFIFYSLRYIHNKSAIKFFLCVLIASMFHNSALICILFYIFSNWISKSKSLSISNIKYTIFYLAILLSPFIIFYSLNLITLIPIFNKYRVFLNVRFDIGFGALFIILLFVAPILIFKNNIFKYYPNYQPFYYLVLLNFPFRYFGYFSNVGGRISLYAELFFYILIPLTLSSIKKKNEKRIVFLYYVIIILIRYINQSLISNGGETYPYLFNIH